MADSTSTSKAFWEGLTPSVSSGLTSVAEAGLAALDRLPVPTRRSERWKYSPLTRMLAQPLNSPKAPHGIPEDIRVQPIPGLDAYRVVLVNGHVVTEACDLPVAEGVICMPLFQALDEGRLQGVDADWSGYHER